jgi:hypothetical protein
MENRIIKYYTRGYAMEQSGVNKRKLLATKGCSIRSTSAEVSLTIKVVTEIEVKSESVLRVPRGLDGFASSWLASQRCELLYELI